MGKGYISSSMAVLMEKRDCIEIVIRADQKADEDMGEDFETRMFFTLYSNIYCK